MNDILPPGEPEIRKPNGQFSAGNPGRPKGAKAKVASMVKDTIAAAFEQASASGDGTMLEQAISVQVKAAAAGDLNALIVLLNYWVGRPRQADKVDERDLNSAVVDLINRIKASPDGDFRPDADMVGQANE